MPPEAAIHETAICESPRIAPGTRIGAFASLAADAVVGEECVIGQGVSIGPGVVLGDRVTVGAGARLVANLHVGADVTILENAVLGGEQLTSVGHDALVGANVTVRPGVGVGQGAVLEPGAVAADPVPANAIVRGNPALIVGYVADDPSTALDIEEPPTERTRRRARETRVPGVRVHPVTCATDLRGSLVASEFAELPFVPQRVFTVFGVSSEFIRGSHAHRECEQFLICVTGSIRCLVDNGTVRDEVSLESPEQGLHMPAMIWGTQYRYTRDALLLVLASHPYDAGDYIRDYEEFLSLRGASPGQ